MSLYKRATLFGCVSLLLVTTVGGSQQQEEQSASNSVTHQNVEINNRHDIAKFNNHKTNNYVNNETRYQPNLVTQLFFGVPKAKKARVSRPPSVEEFALKQKIQQVYQAALADTEATPSSNLMHLGKIIDALNPKYIATERVLRVAYDPNGSVSAPENELDPPVEPLAAVGGNDDGGLIVESAASQAVPFGPHMAPILTLSSDSETPIVDQLDNLMRKFHEVFSWDNTFAHKLSQVDDKQLSPKLIAFKRLLQCLAFPPLCQSFMSKQAKKQQQQQQQQQLQQLQEPSTATYGNNHLKVSVPIPPVKIDFKPPRVVAAAALPPPEASPANEKAPTGRKMAPESNGQQSEVLEEASGVPQEYFNTYQQAPGKRQQRPPPLVVDLPSDEYGGYGQGYGLGQQDNYNNYRGDGMVQQPPVTNSWPPQPTYYGPSPVATPSYFSGNQYNSDLTDRLQQRYGPLESPSQLQQAPQQTTAARLPKHRSLRSRGRNNYQ